MKQEVQEEFIHRLLNTVNEWDKGIRVAYEKRRQALIELQEWLVEALKEASDGEVSSNDSG